MSRTTMTFLEGDAGESELQRILPSPRGMALGQGLYYLGAGLWPMVNLRSFLTVTGPKTDLWLVRTVAVLVSVIGSVLTVAWARGKTGLEVSLLGIGSAAALAGVELTYVLRRRISPIYLADAGVELSLVVGWMAAWALSSRRSR